VGLIGLFGVIVGGIIQVLIQRKQLLEAQTEKIRSECAELVVATAQYGMVAVQASGVFDEATDDLKAKFSRMPWARRLNLFKFRVDSDYWERLGEEFMSGFKSVYGLSISLAGCRDRKISKQAMEIHHKATDFHNKVAQIFLGNLAVRKEEVDELRKDLNYEASVLMTMVSPRWFESFWRFRSVRWAKAGITRQQKRKKKSQAGESPASLEETES